eukprot:UN30587
MAKSMKNDLGGSLRSKRSSDSCRRKRTSSGPTGFGHLEGTMVEEDLSEGSREGRPTEMTIKVRTTDPRGGKFIDGLSTTYNFEDSHPHFVLDDSYGEEKHGASQIKPPFNKSISELDNVPGYLEPETPLT